MLGKTDPEDRTLVELYFLGHYVDTSRINRRVYIDLGVNSFASSIGYMLSNYPAHFTEIYGFECCILEGLQFSDADVAARLAKRTTDVTYTVEEVRKITNITHAYVDGKEDLAAKPPRVALHSLLRRLGVTKADFVVVKMDVEGYEYAAIEALLADGAHNFIDELFLEVRISLVAMPPSQHSSSLDCFADPSDVRVVPSSCFTALVGALQASCDGQGRLGSSCLPHAPGRTEDVREAASCWRLRSPLALMHPRP